MYNELLTLRYDVKGLTGMFDFYRQLLKEADEGTVQYMIEEQKKEIEAHKQEIVAQKQEIAELKTEISEKDTETARNLLKNGVDYTLVRKSISSLSDAELQTIYKEVTEIS